jgi:hypothetical protein
LLDLFFLTPHLSDKSFRLICEGDASTGRLSYVSTSVLCVDVCLMCRRLSSVSTSVFCVDVCLMCRRLSSVSTSVLCVDVCLLCRPPPNTRITPITPTKNTYYKRYACMYLCMHVCVYVCMHHICRERERARESERARERERGRAKVEWRVFLEKGDGVMRGHR